MSKRNLTHISGANIDRLAEKSAQLSQGNKPAGNPMPKPAYSRIKSYQPAISPSALPCRIKPSDRESDNLSNTPGGQW